MLTSVEDMKFQFLIEMIKYCLYHKFQINSSIYARVSSNFNKF